MAKTLEKAAAPPKGGMKNLVLLIVVGLMAVAAGSAVPFFVKKSDKAKEQQATTKESKPALIPFGDAVVNLSEGRLTRYLRVKLILVVSDTEEKTITDLLAKKKPFLRNWLLGYLSDRSLEEVSGTAGVNRLRREIRDQFNAMLFPDGAEKIDDVLFEEFVVQ